MCNERMNILKKTIAVLLSAALIFGAIFMSGAFSASAEDNTENIESTSASQVTSDPDESVTEAPTVEPTQEPTQEPVADPTQEPTQEPLNFKKSTVYQMMNRRFIIILHPKD